METNMDISIRTTNEATNTTATSSSSSSTEKEKEEGEEELLLLLLFPEILLDEILSYLFFHERCRFWQTCRRLRNHHRPQSLHLLSSLQLRNIWEYKSFSYMTTCTSRQTLPPMIRNLRTLELQQYCTNEFLYHMNLPQLQKLTCRRSLNLTNLGLEYLSQSSCQQSLQIVDITYCRNTTYAGTFPLRQRLLQLQVLRRQPEWLDGHFHTPFGNGGNETTTAATANGDTVEQEEIHTYYPDGSFSFSRESQSTGFVCDLVEYPGEERMMIGNNNNNNNDNDNTSGNFVGDKLQYNNFRAPLGWPQWTRYCYRPGVSLLRLPPPPPQPSTTTTTAAASTGDTDDNNNNSTNNNNNNIVVEHPRCVLVGQRLRGLRPPQERALMESVKDNIDIGQSKFYDKHGRPMINLDDTNPELDRTSITMISKMKVSPLLPNEMLPPLALVQACQETCDSMEAFGQSFLTRREEELHTLLDQDTV